MEYKKTLAEVKKALEAADERAGGQSSPKVTVESPGVQVKRILERLEKISSS